MTSNHTHFKGRKTSLTTDKGQFPIYIICVTGGPCSGVTTAIASLSSFLTKHGFKAFTVPDADQILLKGGPSLKNLKLPFYQKVRFLIHNMQMQMDLEDTFIDLAQDSE